MIDNESDVFDQQAARYDAWYDTPLGRAVAHEEQAALRPLLAELRRPWLEVGVGSGRFAAAFGIEVGIDPARGALAFAARRGILTVAGRGEALPFRDCSFGAVVFTAALCFVADPLRALMEARRVLRPEGRVLLGLIPAEGPWGRRYRALAADGHPHYRRAHFLARDEVARLLAAAGLRAIRTRSALFWPPEAEPMAEVPQEGDAVAAGFTAVLVEVLPL